MAHWLYSFHNLIPEICFAKRWIALNILIKVTRITLFTSQVLRMMTVTSDLQSHRHISISQMEIKKSEMENFDVIGRVVHIAKDI